MTRTAVTGLNCAEMLLATGSSLQFGATSFDSPISVIELIFTHFSEDDKAIKFRSMAITADQNASAMH